MRPHWVRARIIKKMHPTISSRAELIPIAKLVNEAITHKAINATTPHRLFRQIATMARGLRKTMNRRTVNGKNGSAVLMRCQFARYIRAKTPAPTEQISKFRVHKFRSQSAFCSLRVRGSSSNVSSIAQIEALSGYSLPQCGHCFI